MLAQLIQALYNIVDSFFVGKYSESALTALSVIYPLQLIIIALAVGTGVGVNTYMARLYAQKMPGQAEETAGTGTLLALGTWFIFAIFSIFCMRPYVLTSANTPEAIESAVIYGQIVCIGSIGAFLEGNWTKVHQSRGNMHRPMVAQTVGALTNIVLDPILIFGLGPVPELGVAGGSCGHHIVWRGWQIARAHKNAALYQADLLVWLRVDYYAGIIYSLYRDLKCDSCRIFRFGSDGAGALL
mgnify:CR=1 FL=1